MAEQVDYSGQFGDVTAKIRDIEQKQKIMKDRIFLIGENLIELKDRTEEKLLGIKKDVEIMKQNLDRLSSFLGTVSGEFSKFAKKEDLQILTKQAKMFQPLDFVRKSDLQR